jgi:hypothetical protein
MCMHRAHLPLGGALLALEGLRHAPPRVAHVNALGAQVACIRPATVNACSSDATAQ